MLFGTCLLFDLMLYEIINELEYQFTKRIEVKLGKRNKSAGLEILLRE